MDVFIIENPTTNQLTINNNTNQEIRVTAFNLFGSKVSESYSIDSLIEIDASSWDSDFYIVLVNQGNKIFTQ